jgi:hypothetical protein
MTGMGLPRPEMIGTGLLLPEKTRIDLAIARDDWKVLICDHYT